MKNLYNGGSEWQNDYSNMPDYYQTYNRNYDAALGRFVSVDSEPESAESMSNYQYAGNLPMMFNDPDGARFTTPQYAGNNGTANLQNEETEFESSVSELDVLNEIAYWSYSGNWDGGGTDYSGFWNALLGQVFGPRDNYNYLDFDSQAMDQLYIHYNEVGDGNFRLGFINSRIVEAVAPESDKEQQSSGQTAGLPGGMNSSDDQSGIFSYASDVSYGDGGLTGNAAFQIASYKPFTIWSVAKGFLVDVSSDASDDIPGLTPATASSTVTVSTVSAGRYEVAARVNLHFENSQWVLTTTAYYIGAKIDNMFFTTSTSELVNGVYYNSHHIERSAGDDTVLPTGWTYLGRTRYYFPNNNPWGNFGLYVHVGVGIWHFEGNEAGSGYIDIVVPITK